MTVRFFDRQDKSNPLNGVAVRSSEALVEILDGLTDREPFFCELIGDNDFALLIGIGASFGCVQFSRSDGCPPYLMAVATDPGACAADLEFLTADTLTPVSYRYCLPLDLVKVITTYFQETGCRSPLMVWEEI